MALRSRLGIVAFALGALGAGCSRSGRAVPAADSASVPSSAVPSARSSSDPSRGPAAPSAAPSGGAALAATFARVAELPCGEARLHPLDGVTLLSCGKTLWEASAGGLRRTPEREAGLHPDEPDGIWGITAVAGAWPDAAWLSTTRSTTYSGQSHFFRWRGARWEPTSDANVDECTVGIVPWSDGGALGLVQPGLRHATRFVPIGVPAAKVPRFTAPAQPNDACRSRLSAEAFAVLAPGDAMVLGGQICDPAGAAPLPAVYAGLGAERLRVGEAQGSLAVVPTPAGVPGDATWKVTGAAVLSPTELWIAANSYVEPRGHVPLLARWDGARFTLERPPNGAVLEQLWAERPALLWATDLEGGLWRGRGGRWQRVEGPPLGRDDRITTVLARAADDVWIVVTLWHENRSVVFHGRVGP